MTKPFPRPGFNRRLLAVLLVGYGLAFCFFGKHAPRIGWKTAGPAAPRFLLEPVRPGFYHDEIVEWTLRPDSAKTAAALKEVPLWTWVERGTVPVTTVGELQRVRLSHDPASGHWRGRWPVPWNAPDGPYHIRIDTSAWPADLPELYSEPFEVVSRTFEPMPEGFGVLTLENFVNFYKVKGPTGRVGVEGLADWVEFIGADALWVQGGESSGYSAKLPRDFPWYTQSDGAIRDLGRELHRRGLKLGVYVLDFMIGGPARYSPDYAYGWHYEKGRIVNGLDLPKRRGISITDPQRPLDIVKALERWRDMEEVDFLGLDYIRPVFGSYELVDDFVRDMAVKTPENWKVMSFQERMLWLARGRYLAPTPALRKEPRYALTDQWFWYRAHRTAQVVRRITSALGEKKPIWAFTLSWQKGWEHGQDPVMMRDAGVDLDAIMLYEADGEQFRGLVKQWGAYAGQKQINLLVGDAIDWPLHQRTLNPAGPEDFFNRNMLAVEGFHADKPVRGLFVHDYYRGMRGRLGPYGTEEWMLAGGAGITRLRELHRRLPYGLSLRGPDKIHPGAAEQARISLSGSDAPVSVKVYSSGDLDVSPREFTLSSAQDPVQPLTVRWTPNASSAARANRAFLAIRAERGKPGERCQIHIMYVQGQRR